MFTVLPRADAPEDADPRTRILAWTKRESIDAKNLIGRAMMLGLWHC